MARRLLLPVLAPAFVLALAGCGGSSPARHASAGSTATQPTSAKAASGKCSRAVRARALARLQADVAAVRRAAALPTKDTLDGNAAVNRATDRFLEDVSTLPVDNLVRNRMIDHAAAALVGSCTQCFQALEANRPIPAIAHGDRGSCASKSSG